MKKSTFSVPKMDCPSEESLIRMKLEGLPSIGKLEFNIADRKVIVYHDDDIDPITNELESLNLGAVLLSTETDITPPADSDAIQKKALYLVLGINFIFFLIEVTAGLLSHSMGLIADGVDMLADAFVYLLSLMAVGHAVSRKKTVAGISGSIQLLLAALGFGEVIRRFIGVDTPPEFRIMIITSVSALAANITSLVVLQKARSSDAHIKASMICTSNDVIVNVGVITAGVLVNVLNSNKPDLVIGAIVFILVVQGAFRILQLAR